MQRFHRKVVVPALVLAAALVGAAPAHANVYALSALSISSLSLVATSGSATASTFIYQLSNTATLNGTSTISTGSCNSTSNPCGSSPVLDAAPANGPLGSPTRTNNNFGFLGFGGSTNFSNSDSVITAASQGTPTAAQSISESYLTTTGNAAATALIQSSTSFSFTVAVNTNGTNLSLTFNADPDLEAMLSGLGTVGSAQADVSTTFALRDGNGQTLVSWAPTGTSANDCFSALAGVTCTETADTQNLNTGVGSTTTNTDITGSFDVAQTPTAFGLAINGLATGSYNVVFTAGTSTLLLQTVVGTQQTTVPEPATTVLLGAGLAGLAVMRKRRYRADL